MEETHADEPNVGKELTDGAQQIGINSNTATENDVPKKRKRPEHRSVHWIGYTEVTVMEGDPPVQRRKAKCDDCDTLIAAESRANGTTGLRNHKLTCPKRNEEAAGQILLNYQAGTKDDGSGASLTTWRFDQKEVRLGLCEMIILDELPFRFVEHEGFKKFVARACPIFKIPSRKTIREDCVVLFLQHKGLLKSVFQKKGSGRVSITTDCWTSINNTNFICVTAHFIGNNWDLQKKIIGFRKIVSHKGDDIGESLITTLNEWDVKSLFCCTVDNASANDVAVRYLKDKLQIGGTNILDGKYMHLRCVAHIINLIVSDGLDEIGLSVRRVREAVKFIRGSPARIEQFELAKRLLTNGCKKLLCMDVPTRWNSTYLMLESAEPYEAVIKLYEGMNPTFVSELIQKKYKDEPIGPPQAQDWTAVRKMMEYLKKFFDLTNLVSGTTYVTAHLFFKEMCDILDLISELQRHNDVEIRSMATKMKMKVGKYWYEADELNPKMNKILYVVALLDPRQKLKHVEKCLRKIYGVKRAAVLLNEIREVMNELFEAYKKSLTSTQNLKMSMSAPSTREGCSSQQHDIQRRSTRVSTCSTMVGSSDEEYGDDCSELTLYFAEKKFREVNKRAPNQIGAVVDNFKILKWWSTHGIRFPILSAIAKDVLAIPISTVASESAFSTGGRVLSEFRSSLNPNMVEALICCEDWLRSTYKHDEEDTPEEEQDREYLRVLNAFGAIGLGGVEGGSAGPGSSNNQGEDGSGGWYQCKCNIQLRRGHNKRKSSLIRNSERECPFLLLMNFILGTFVN